MNSINEPPREHLSFDLYHPPAAGGGDFRPFGSGQRRRAESHAGTRTALSFCGHHDQPPPRENEINGVDYFFTTREHFEELIRQNEFIEWALVYDDYKGVPKSQIRQALASGKDVILRVDVQGAATFRKLCPEAVLIFLIPQDEAEWMERLKNRKTETPESLKLRLETARAELERLNEFDYVVVNANDRLDEAVDTIVDIINAEHHRVHPRRSCV